MNAEPSLEPLPRRLRALLPDLRRRYGVESLEMFGSRVRADACEESDLDLLVTFTEVPDLLTLISLEHELSERVGIPIDLVMRRSLKPRLRQQFLGEASRFEYGARFSRRPRGHPREHGAGQRLHGGCAYVGRPRSGFQDPLLCCPRPRSRGRGREAGPGISKRLDSAIPWKEMAGMRDRLIHAYETVDVEFVFKTVRDRIPEVEPRVRLLLERFGTGS